MLTDFWGYKMDLHIYNQSLEKQGVLDSYESYRRVRRYKTCGEFELSCPLTSKNLELLTIESIIAQKVDDEAGYINYRNLIQNDKGNEILTVKGKFLTGYFNRRIVWGTEVLETTNELAMRELITKHAISPTDADRAIPNLILGDLQDYTETVKAEVSYIDLLSELESLSAISESGFRVRFDRKNKNLIFEVYEGVDRTSNQTLNAQCKFSRKFENVIDQEYTDSISNYKNVVLVGGLSDNDDSDRRFVTVGSGTELARFEVFNNQGSLAKTVNGTVLTAAKYDELLTEKGNATLAKMTTTQSFDSTINLKSNIEYRTDFDLGDKVTIISKDWGIVLETRIMEIEEYYDSNGLTVSVVFGDEAPTLIEKIKQLIK